MPAPGRFSERMRTGGYSGVWSVVDVVRGAFLGRALNQNPQSKMSGNWKSSNGNDWKANGNDWKSANGNDWKANGNDWKANGNDWEANGNDWIDWSKKSGNDCGNSGNLDIGKPLKS